MKTPEEIKTGFKCLMPGECPEDCPYRDVDALDCRLHLMKDAIAYIQKLERERDAAVADLNEAKDCTNCKNECNCKSANYDCKNCNVADCPCKVCRYEWRGVKEADHA